MLIERIEFKNFKVLRDAVLPLGRFTLIVGPNGSGKTTALRALQAVSDSSKYRYDDIVSVGVTDPVDVRVTIQIGEQTAVWGVQWLPDTRDRGVTFTDDNGSEITNGSMLTGVRAYLNSAPVFAFGASNLASDSRLAPSAALQEGGDGLVGVLDRLRDLHPERFDQLNSELERWFPDYDRILFDVPADGERTFLLRGKDGSRIPARDLSEGTLFGIALLSLAYSAQPPPIVAFESPDRGMHPRLLREVKDALYRLAYPEDFDDERDPVQVIATTHSPYLLDLFREHTDEIVIAEKVGQFEGRFERLEERADIHEILGDAPLGEAWFSGVLGGVPTAP